ncbi:MAG: CoA pyrophosphatase [Actinomycetota bacterium]
MIETFDDDLRAHLAANLSAFERGPVPVTEELRHAAVAIAIAGDETGAACFLLTRRAANLRRHAAQWALPGGRLDAGETPADGALRELEEEVGLRVDAPNVMGTLDDYPTRSGYLITPVVVWTGPTPSLHVDPAEVESAHLVPLAELDKPEFPKLIPGTEPDRPIIQLPLFGRFVHAPTAAVLYQFREVGFHGRATRVAHFDQPTFAWR